MLYRDLILPKINSNTIYIQKICKENILLKYNVNGSKFLSLDFNKIEKIENRINIDKIFNSFNMPMYETLTENTPVKIYLDLDFQNKKEIDYKNRSKLFLDFNNKLIEFLFKKNILYKSIKYMDASRLTYDNKYKLSLHVIVNGVGFKNRKILKRLIIDFKDSFDKNDIFYHAIDVAPYNTPQLFKSLLSPSKNDNTLLIPFDFLNEKMIKTKKEFIYDNILDYFIGIYKEDGIKYLDKDFSYFSNTNDKDELKKSKNINIKEIPENFNNNIIKIPYNKEKWILNNKYIKGIFILKNNNIINNKIDLIRINSAHCNICNRTHDNENAFCKVTENAIFFHCGRNPSNGVGIGFWYNNKNISVNDYVEKNKYKKLQDEFNKLKEYSNKLEIENKELKREFNLLSNKNPKYNKVHDIGNIKKDIKYTKNINTNMWQKYYDLGSAVINNNCNMLNSLLTNWKDNSIGRLKKRGVLIFEYLNYLKENNLENKLSLRKIFHKKDYESFSTIYHNIDCGNK